MSKIRKLPEQIINLIAAGEVVERPASVLKELLENSIDSGANKITIKVKNGGLELIEVEDNGSGMDTTDALLAFTQHATSKIYSEEDLANISTLGFRGEALASISSVADVEMETLASEGEPTRINASQSTLEHLDGSKTDCGTSIKVSNLFSAIPARKKFMKSESTEFRHIQDLFQTIALTQLDIHLELWHNDKLNIRLPRTSNFTDRVFDLWGKDISGGLYEVESQLNNYKIKAYLGSPDIARRDRSKQYLYINGRAITDRVVQRAINEAYKGFMHRDLNAVYFIFLELPGSEVDVNVHPRKLEVRFSDSGNVYRFVYNTLRTKLEGQTNTELKQRVESERQESSSFSRPNNTFKDYNTNPSSAVKPSKSEAISFTKQLLRPLDNHQTVRSESIQTEPEQQFSYSQPLQLFNTYIVYEKGEDVIFIDQHAAAESIQYERILAQSDISKSKQKLVPEIIELKQNQKEEILKHKEHLASFGLQIEDFGGESIQITATPEVLDKFDSTGFIQDYLQNLDEFEDVEVMDIEKDIKRNLEIHNPIMHRVIATLACHGSIRAGQSLSVIEMQQLIRNLAESDNTYNCPHGRPVSWVMSRTDLEKNFNRIVS